MPQFSVCYLSESVNCLLKTSECEPSHSHCQSNRAVDCCTKSPASISVLPYDTLELDFILCKLLWICTKRKSWEQITAGEVPFYYGYRFLLLPRAFLETCREVTVTKFPDSHTETMTTYWGQIHFSANRVEHTDRSKTVSGPWLSAVLALVLYLLSMFKGSFGLFDAYLVAFGLFLPNTGEQIWNTCGKYNLFLNI